MQYNIPNFLFPSLQSQPTHRVTTHFTSSFLFSLNSNSSSQLAFIMLPLSIFISPGILFFFFKDFHTCSHIEPLSPFFGSHGCIPGTHLHNRVSREEKKKAIICYQNKLLRYPVGGLLEVKVLKKSKGDFEGRHEEGSESHIVLPSLMTLSLSSSPCNLL